MSLLDDLKNSVIAANPQLVVTAPDGQKLYVPISPEKSDGTSDGSSLWPNGFKISLAVGNAPTAGDVTTSPTDFFYQQSPVLLTAPGPAGIPWGLLLLIPVILIGLPFLIKFLRK